MSNQFELISFNADGGYFWAATPVGLRIGEAGQSKEYKLEGMPGIFSSSSLFTGVPKSYSKVFFKMLLKGKKHVLEDGIFYVPCNTVFEQDVYFMFARYWIQISARDLIVDVSTNQDNSLCAVTFIPSINDYWWFGLNIYKDYYVIHNMSQKTLGFVPTEDNIKEEIQIGKKPTRKLPSYNVGMMFLKLFVGGTFAVGYWLMIKYVFKPTSFTGFNFLN